MRALESLSPDSPPPGTTSQGPSHPLPPPRRATEVVKNVLSVLSPLVIPSQELNLRNELLALANVAISVWTAAQTDELKFTVYLALDLATRNEWRSSTFDPLPLFHDNNNTDIDIVSSTHPRIFTLFPRIIARKVVGSAKPPMGPPGSWPEAEQEPRMIETCIHTGTGLPEWSALVVKGKQEEQERKEYLSEAMQRAKNDLIAKNTRNGWHSRSGSMVGSVSGPPSPTAQWRNEGGNRVVVEE